MKKFTLFLVIAAILGTLSFSCSSDDDLTTPGTIVGQWRVLTATVSGTNDGTVFGPINIDYTTNPERSILSFNANLTFNSRVYEADEDGELALEEDSGTYRINGNNLITSSEDGEERTVTFLIQNNRLIITNTETEGNSTRVVVITAERI